MIRQRLLVAALIAVLASPPVVAQSRGDVITPPPIKSDGSVIRPPAEHADPGIEKGKPTEQSQLPPDENKQRRDRPPGPRTNPGPKTDPAPKMDDGG
jgi:hypothetical protein